MSVEKEIGNMIRAIAQDKKESVCTAVVTKVNGNACAVQLVDDGGRELENVSLNAVLKDEEKNGLLITPVIGSQVLIASINGHSWFVCQYSEIEKVTLNSTNKIEINGGEKIEINAAKDVVVNSSKKAEISATDKITLNGEDNGGLVLSEKVQSELNTIIQRVNNIVIALSQIAAAANTTGITPATGVSVAGFITPNISSLLVPLITPQKTIFENAKVTH